MLPLTPTCNLPVERVLSNVNVPVLFSIVPLRIISDTLLPDVISPVNVVFPLLFLILAVLLTIISLP